MTFDEVITFAREEHARYLGDLTANVRAGKSDPDPLPHLFLFDNDARCEVFALAMGDAPNLKDFLHKFRLTIQAKILLEGAFASVYCGIVLVARAATPEIQKAVRHKAQTDAHFLQTLEKEIGLQNRQELFAVAESAGRQFVLQQAFYVRERLLHLDGEPVERLDQGVPRLPYTGFKWGERSSSSGFTP
jgi:hypothetical protein